ncbi:MAG: pseudouridine synthase [Verrucomicrobiales bacterium]
MLLAFFKPYGVLSQFTPNQPNQRTLAEFCFPPRVYPIGRLDGDSEGLLLLSDQAGWNELLNPRRAHPREYHVQVEGIITPRALDQLAAGVVIQGKRTRLAKAQRLETPPIWPPREPPTRYRKSVPDCWLSLELTEGRNRQVRRMAAAVGFPVLRLIRVRIGKIDLRELRLQPGEWCELDAKGAL